MRDIMYKIHLIRFYKGGLVKYIIYEAKVSLATAFLYIKQGFNKVASDWNRLRRAIINRLK
jgi:hypothetical protein